MRISDWSSDVCSSDLMNKEMELLRIFRVAAESSSFRDAAVRLGTSPQGVTRAIQQLEQHYGEVLFHRSTRQVRHHRLRRRAARPSEHRIGAVRGSVANA